MHFNKKQGLVAILCNVLRTLLWGVNIKALTLQFRKEISNVPKDAEL